MADLLPILIPVWLGLAVVAALIWRVRSGKPVMPRVPAGAAYGETWVSGRPLGGGLRGMAHADNCLVVVVDRGRLTVGLAFPFSILPLPGLGALTVDVAVETVRSVRAYKRWWNDVLEIAFTDPARRSIELTLQDEAGFVRALGVAKVSLERPLRTRRWTARWSKRIGRGFLIVWGAAATLGAGMGLVNDLGLRSHGQTVVATVVEASRKNTVLRYQVDGVNHEVAAHINGGTRRIGDTETVYVDPANPDRMSEPYELTFELVFVTVGMIVLAIGLLGARMVPGWS